MSAQSLVINLTFFADSHDNVGRAVTTTWGKLAARLGRHDEGAKDGPALACATFNGRRGNAALVSRSLIALDIETNKTTGEVPPHPADMAGILAAKRLACVVWSTHSHQASEPRWRAVFPLSKPLPLPDDNARATDMFLSPTTAAQLGLAGVADRSKFGASSLMFLPRHPPGGEWYAKVFEGDPIDTDELMAIAIMVSEKVQADEAKVAAMRARNALPPEIVAVIEAYNDRHPLEGELARFGYKRTGRRWKSSNQHGAASTVILPGGRTFVSFSASDADAGVGARPLRASSQAAAYGTAFDLLRTWLCRGSFREALRIAREEVSQ